MKNNTDIELRLLSESDKAAYDNFIQEFRDAEERVIPSEVDEKNLTFIEFLERTRKNAKGIDLPLDRVPSAIYYLFNKDSNKILGAVDIRYELNDSLLKNGGNIGYGVAPSERKKGYANYMLGRAINICKVMGLEKVLITCDKGNIGSAKTIIKNGGVLENEAVDDNGTVKQRYWIAL